MALEAIAQATAYHDTAKVLRTEQSENDGKVQNNINISEVPAPVKASAGNQTDAAAKDKSPDQIKDAISKANNNMRQHRTTCEFSYHEDTKRVAIKVIDRDTKEVIREIPPEEVLDMLEKIWELAGLIVDEKR